MTHSTDDTRLTLIVRSGAICFVEPGHQIIEAGQRVTLRALEDAGRVVLLFPTLLFEEDDTGRIVLPLEGNKRSGKLEPSDDGRGVTLTVRDGLEPGAYPYAVFCEDVHDFAVGGSHPIYIVQ